MVQPLWGAATDAGGRRRVNEDAVLARPPVFLVSDGMGGHRYGEVAAQCVVRAFAHFADRLAPGAPVEPEQVDDVIRSAQGLIRTRLGAGLPGQRGGSVVEDQATEHHAGQSPIAGATVTGAILTTRGQTPYWLVFNVGDSRVYRFDDSGLKQISVDHSEVQELVDAGTITPQAARSHPGRNVITRAIDDVHPVRADYWMLHAGKRQRLLLCSDGLVGELGTDQIADLMAADRSPAQASADLVRCAVAGGAHDNVSAVVVQPPAGAGVGTTVPQPMAPWAEEDLDDTIPRTGAGVPR